MGEAKRRKALDSTFGKEKRVISRVPTELLDGPEHNFDYNLPSGFLVPIVKGQPPVDLFLDVSFNASFFCAEYLYFDEFFSVIHEACSLKDQPVTARPVFASVWQKTAARLTGNKHADPFLVSSVDDMPDSVASFTELLLWIAQKQGYQVPLTKENFESCFWDVMACAIDADELADATAVKAKSLNYFLDTRRADLLIKV